MYIRKTNHVKHFILPIAVHSAHIDLDERFGKDFPDTTFSMYISGLAIGITMHWFMHPRD